MTTLTIIIISPPIILLLFSYFIHIIRIIIAIIQAGGVSLHDLHRILRMSLISPTWSGQDLVQCLGRIHRADVFAPAQQRIVFCADTYEERISEILQKKLQILWELMIII